MKRPILLLLSLVCAISFLPGCLWVPITVGIILATTGSDGGGGSTTPAALGIEVQQNAGLPEGIGEGQMEFLVTLERPAVHAAHVLQFSYECSDRVERPCVTAPRLLCRSAEGILEPVGLEWRIAPGTEREERIVVWDTGAEGIQYEPSVSFIAKWGPLKAYSRRFDVDNTEVPGIDAMIEVLPRACYGDPVRLQIGLASWIDKADSGGPSSGPVTLEATLHVLRSASGFVGEIPLPRFSRTLDRGEWEAGEVTVEWRTEEQLPDDLAEVEVEVVPLQVKYGLPVRTAPFEVDNRLPRPVSTDRRRVPNDRSFELTVYGTGLSTEARVALVMAGSEPVSFLKSVALVPGVSGPTGIAILFSHAEGPGLEAQRGPVDVWIENPNCRRGKLEGALFLGPSTVSYAGSFYPLSEKPVDVAVGDFVPDPEGIAKPILDVAVITTVTSPPVVVVLGGDGKGNLPERWIVPLQDEEASALAIAEVPSPVGGLSAILVATTKGLELVQADPAAEPVMIRAETVAELGSEDVGSSITVADFNGDGLKDAAVSSFNRSRVDVFLGIKSQSGGIAFDSIPACSLGSGIFGFPRALAAANFDLKVNQDLVVLAEEAGAPTLFLFLSDDGGCFGSEPHDSIPFRDAGDCIAASDDSSFEDVPKDNAHPDILVCLRSDEVTRVFVRPDEASGKLKLEINPRSSSLSGRARDIALIHLPGGAVLKKSKREVIDYATVDAGSGAMSYAYTDDAGDGSEYSGNYPLPGEGQALAVGDLDGNGYQDIVAVTDQPPLAAVFLVRSPETVGIEEDPFRYPSGLTAGEEPLRTPGALGVGYGDARAGGGEPFLATVSRVREELTVFFLDPAMLGLVERYGHVGAKEGESRTGVRSLIVADFDGKDGDDIVVAASRVDRLILFRNRGSGSPRFQAITILDLNDPDLQGVPEFLRNFDINDEVGFRIINQAKLDGNDLPDLILPLTVKKIELDGVMVDCISDFAVVIKNPGNIPDSPADPPQPDVHFYRTLDDPRHAAAADVNGDGVLDLLVACENKKSQYKNSVHIIFGDPSSPGKFIQAGDDPMEPSENPLHPIRLPGIEEGGEVENVGFFQEAKGECPGASWIVVSNSYVSSIYQNFMMDPQNCISDPQKSCFSDPVMIYDGGDPEDLLAIDLFPDPDDLPDLAILDEGRGEMVLLRNTGCAKFVSAGLPFEIGSPQEIAWFKRGDILTLAVVSRSQQEIVLYERNCDADEPSDCAFTPARTIELVEAEVFGDHNSLSCTRVAPGSLLVASLVEDGPKRLGLPAVDFTVVEGPPAGGGPVILSSLARIELEAPMDPKDEPALVLLGRFLGGDDVPDLLIASTFGVLSVHPGSAEGQVPQGPPPEGQALLAPVGAAISLDLSIGEQPTDGELVREVPGEALVALSTESRVHLLRIGPGPEADREWSFVPAHGIRRIASGKLGAKGETGDFRGTIFLVLLGDQDLTVVIPEGNEGGNSFNLGNPKDSWGRLDALGVRDVNLDGLDDILVIDGTRSTLEVFRALEGGLGVRFGPGQKISYAAVGALPVDIAFLDGNGDGLVDACFGTKSGEVIVFLGNGDGSFEDPQSSYAGPEVEGVRSIDLDGDGTEESILVSNTIPGLVVLSPGGGRP